MSARAFSQSFDKQLPVVLDTAGSYELRSNQLFYFEDKLTTITENEILKMDTDFRPVAQHVLNMGYTKSALWLRIKTNNKIPDRLWKMEISNSNLDSVNYYMERDGALTLIQQTTKYDKEEVNFIFPVGPGLRTYYIRVKSYDPLHVPIKIIDSKSLLDERWAMDIWQGIYMGIILALALYNLFVYFSILEKAYLFYNLYIINIGLSIIYTTGYLPVIIGHEARLLNKLSIVSSLSGIFGILFINIFLNLNSNSKARIMSTAIAFFFIVSIVLQVFNFTMYASVSMQIGAFVFSIYYLIKGIESLRTGYRPAKFFVIAWTTFLTGIVVFTMKDFGFLPYNFYTEHIVQVGNAAEAILLSFALADKIAYLRKQKEQAELNEQKYLIRYNTLVSSQNEVLQTTVKTRTLELERANDIKDRFFTIIAHDLRTPLNSLSGFLGLFEKHTNSMSIEDLKANSKELSASLRNTIELTDNLLAWARSQMKLEEHKPVKINLARTTRQVVNHLKSTAAHKKIDIVEHIPEEHDVFADENQFQFVLRNLVSNSIKFTPAGGWITISSELTDGKIAMSIADNGIGIEASRLSTLFDTQKTRSTRGTAGERGTGLGLMLCKEFVERNGGEISVISEQGEGTIFTFRLPAAPAIV
ncbi:hypothetical protein WSM22_31900 [Cytophagales bacterium WSM2-2]|nr:hypothetical protein WSM22_31900 [Cytophagales bacterium WSM2-2]